jgi:hypothetical protein
MSTFDKYLNEINNVLNERSINKIQTEFTDVVNKMSVMAKEYSAAEGDEKANILAELKGLTSQKNDLIKELDSAVAGKDKDLQLAIKESEINEASRKSIKKYKGLTYLTYFEAPKGYSVNGIGELSGVVGTPDFFDTEKEAQEYAEEQIKDYLGESLVSEANPHAKPAGLSKEETMVIAQKFADAMSKADGSKVTVNKRTLEEDSFDLDVDGLEFDGGSYNIFQNGNVMNMALRNNPVYGRKNDSVDTIIKNMKKFANESVINEAETVKSEAISRLAGFFRINPYALSKFNFDGKDNIKELTKVLNSTSDQGTELYYNTAIKAAKKDLGIDESVINEAEKFKSTKEFEDFLEEIDGMPENRIKRIMGKDYIDTPGGYRDEAEDYDNDIEEYMISNMGKSDFNELKNYWETNVAESIVIESKKFYNTKEIVKIANIAGDSVIDAKSAIQDLSIEYGDKVPLGELNKVLADYDLELEDLMESSIIEGKKIILKRQYTENHPASTVGKNANVRNKVLEFIKNGKITKEAFENFVAGLSNNSKRWTKSNSQYFTISEDGVSLSKVGQKILKSITVNEAEFKEFPKGYNPEIWVPGNFDKAISKYPNSKLTRKIVLDAAKKWDVTPEDAINYVEFGWHVDLSENINTNMKTKFIYESFSEFVSSLNESNNSLNEAFASTKLASILTGGNKMPADLPAAFYNMSKLALDKIQDIDILDMDPQTAKKEKRSKAIYMYFTTNEKENPYAGKNSYNAHTIPANTLLAITDGSNEWMNTEWTRSFSSKSSKTLKTTKRDDSAGIDKSSASDQYGSGISSMKQVADLADRAYCLDLDILRARYSTEAQRSERTAARKGAVAFMNDKDFKAENKARYNDILATKASSMPMDSVVSKAIDTLSIQIKDAIIKGEKGKYGDLLIGLDPRGKEVKMSDASNLMRNILDTYSRYVGDVANDEKEKAAGYTGNYYAGSLKNHAKDIQDNVKKIDTLSYAW